MKNCILLVAVCSLLIFFTADIALAEWCIQFDEEANRVIRLDGYTLRGSFATPEECWAYWVSRPGFEQAHSWCVKCVTTIDGNWVRISEKEPEHTTPEDQREKERWAKEEIVREKLLRERQIELYLAFELFELGKSDLLEMLKDIGGEQGLVLKPPPEQETDTGVVITVDDIDHISINMVEAYRYKAAIDGDGTGEKKGLLEEAENKLKGEAISYLSDKTGVPVGKFKAIYQRLIENVVEPFDHFLSKVVECIANPAKWPELIELSERFGRETHRYTLRQIRDLLVSEITEMTGVLAKAANSFFSMFKQQEDQ